MKLNYKRTVLVGMAFFLITAFWQAYDAIVPLILDNHFGLSETASGAIMSIDNVLAVFMLPLFGAISDKVCSRFGKRTPFILVGTVAAVIAFVFIAVVDAWQFNSLVEAGIHDRYLVQQGLLNGAKEALKLAKAAGDSVAVEALNGQIDAINGAVNAIRADVLQMTMGNATKLIAFIAALLTVLIAMATFRSPAVALMPDVTPKPLRSKANAIINLTGTAGGMLVLVLGILFGTSQNISMRYVGYVLSVAAIMVLGLIVFLLTVKEKKWAREMEETSARLGLEKPDGAETAVAGRKLTRPELRSLILILASVALWYIGYNSVTSKYSVYATNILGFDFNVTLLVAQAAAIVAYIPVGMIASRIGRKKSILAGVLMLTAAFFVGNFITAGMPAAIMYPIFALAGIGWATINVNSFPMAVELASGSDVGKYTGYYYTASMAAQIVAPILSGMLYDLVGMRLMFFAFATVFVTLSFVTMLFVKHGDSRPPVKGSVLEQLDVEDR